MSKNYKKTNENIQNYEDLLQENNKIISDIKILEKFMPDALSLKKLLTIKEKFKDVNNQCACFNTIISSSLNQSKISAERSLRSIESHKTVYQNFCQKKSRIKSQEIVIRSQEREWQRSLDKIKGMWEKNLTSMESSIKYQKETIKRIGTQYLKTINFIEKEIREVIEGPKVPNLDLGNIKKTKTPSKQSSGRSSSSHKLSDEDDVISNRSAFSYITEDIVSHRSNSSRPRPPQLKRLNPPLPPAIPLQSVNNSYVSDENVSLEFEKIMSELEKERSAKQNPNSISMEKTIGGWKSEYESEGESISLNLNHEEIKKALLVLKKARLLNAGGNQVLIKLAEMIKDPENSSNVELMLQLINIERKKNKASQKISSRLKASGKPPTPTHASQLKKKVPVDLVGTSRDKFMFSEDKSFNKTILSTENHLSPKENDFFEEGFRNNLNHVNLEDLLNISSYTDNIGLISADTSMIQEETKNRGPDEPKATNFVEPENFLKNNKKPTRKLPVIS